MWSAGYYEYIPAPSCHQHYYRSPSAGYYGDRCGGSLTIGPVRVFWE